jgi:hypothetical protein
LLTFNLFKSRCDKYCLAFGFLLPLDFLFPIMHAPLRPPPDDSSFPTWRHPEGGQHYFDSARVGELMALYNAGEAGVIDELLARCKPLVRSLIKYRQANQYVPTDELTNLVYIKIWKSTRLYDPNRGSPFSFIARVTYSVMCSAISDVWQRTDRFTGLNNEVAESVFAHNGVEAIEDLVGRIRAAIRTIVNLPCEIEAQRWFFQSLVDSRFVLRRHQVADCAMQVFQLSHSRSRQLYDMTILETRRVLLGDHRVSMVQPHQLRGTRIEALIKYSSYLSESDFSKLVCLLRDLPPALILNSEPSNIARFRRGDREAIVENLRLILDGDPRAKPLFNDQLPVRHNLDTGAF